MRSFGGSVLGTAAPYSTSVGQSRQRYCAIAFPSPRRHRVKLADGWSSNNSRPFAKKLSMRQAAELTAKVAPRSKYWRHFTTRLCPTVPLRLFGRAV